MRTRASNKLSDRTNGAAAGKASPVRNVAVRDALLVALLIIAGSIPRLAHAFSGRALWFDEAALCINILERSFGALLAPLDFYQIAPPLYLWFLKACTIAAGANVYAVRLPSLLAGLITLVSFWYVARALLSRAGAITALVLVVLSQHLIYYAGEAKPYAVDALATVVVILAALHLDSRACTSRHRAALAVAFSLLVWVSFPAVFVLAGVGTAQLARLAWHRDWQGLARTVAPYAASAISFGVLLLLVVHPNRNHAETMEYMNVYWRHGFMPFPPVDHWAIRWYRERTFMFFDMPGGFTLQGLALFCALAGAVSLLIRRPWHAAGLLLVIALTLAASTLKLYPFHGRMTLFLVPIQFLLVGEGIILATLRGRGRTGIAACAVLLALLLSQPAVRAGRMAIAPARHHELDVVLRHVQDAWQPGDRIFLRQGDYISYRFLAGRYRFPEDAIGVESRGLVAREGEAAFYAEVDAWLPTGGRVWFPMAFDQESAVADYLAFIESRGGKYDRIAARGALGIGIEIDADRNPP
jgi:hypothetical protein